jgi:hypothetical protein
VTILGLATLAALGARLVWPNAGPLGSLWGGAATSTPSVQTDVAFSYEAVPFDALAKRADIILLAEVKAIGPTRWNQASGDYWDRTFGGGESTVRALPYFQVALSPKQLIVGSDGDAGAELVLTFIGDSPVDDSTARAELGLNVGDSIIAFIERGRIAWFSGRITYNARLGNMNYGAKSTWRLIGVPNEAYLRRQTDGTFRFAQRTDQPDALTLDALATLISELRSAQ